MSAPLTTLENAGYVEIEKTFVGKKPRTARIADTRRAPRLRHSRPIPADIIHASS